ncbi:hypothetical protein EDC04DRAFT_2892453 [Pisolithus marmoratus]|nr:hypothetical protein EDC04DRAFT_2892453 [Pisolithus marmoratus]
MTTPANVLSTRVISARNRLVSSGLYLGDSAIATRLEWVRQDRGHVLSYIPHEVSHANAPTAPAGSVDTGTAEGDGSAESDLSPPPSAAVLSAIVRIDRDDFWLTSDGGYRGPNTFWREILDVKPSCTVSEPGLEPVNLDFVSLESGVVDSDDIPGSATSSTDSFSFELWPLTKEKYRGELLALKSTHRILPLPAYDLTGDLIRPSAYRRCLQGALVEVHFTLSHWPIASLKRDVYGAQIQLIRLLAPPVVTPTTGKKRRIPLHLDADETPSKKAATF